MSVTLVLATLILGAGMAVMKPTAAAEGDVASADGVPIHYRSEGKGSTALVFVHCWACDRHFWDEQAPRFAARYRVVTLDLAGHGQSGKGRGDWTMRAFGEDVAAVVRHLGLKRAVLIGHSMGGPVILEAARLVRDRVVGLIPVDTLLDVDEKLPPEKAEAFLAEFRSDFKGTASRFLREWMFVPATPPALVEAIVGAATAMSPEIGVATLRNAWTYDAPAALREVKTPIVAINADKFPTRLDSARRYAPQFDALIMTGVGHYLMREDPERFGALLDQALRKIGAAR